MRIGDFLQETNSYTDLSPATAEDIVEDTEDFGKNKDLISTDTINLYVNAFRELLKGEETNNNIFRFILSGNKKAIIEKSKLYFPDISIVGCIAIKNIIDEYYDINETYQDPWDDTEPASEIEATIGYGEVLICFENGILELINRETKQKLTVYVNAEVSKPFVKAYSLEGSGEASYFLKKVQEKIKGYDIYKNKTFTLKRSSYVGMVPHFLKPTEVEQKAIISKDIEKVIQANIIDIFDKKDVYKNAKIPLKRGVLFEGEPGCGKTTVVKNIEYRLAGKVTFIYVTDGAIRGASDIADIYNMAREYAPTIVVFEDIDTIGLTRERGSNTFTSELLGQLDGLEVLEGVVTIATTNYPEFIDDALKNRPSRFDRRVKIGLPDDETRSRMFETFLQEKDIDITNIDIKNLTLETKNFSGAMLKEIVITAKMTQVQEKLDIIDNSVLKNAIDLIRTNFYDSQISKSSKRAGFRDK